MEKNSTLTQNIENEEKEKFYKMKKEEYIQKDLLKRYNEYLSNKDKKVFIPMLNNSRLGFYSAQLKKSDNCYNKIGDYYLQTKIPKKINKIILTLEKINLEINESNIKINESKEKNHTSKTNQNDIKIKNNFGSLKKLDEGLVEIIEEEDFCLDDKCKNSSNTLYNDTISDNAYKVLDIQQILEEMKKTKNKFKDGNFVNFADLEFLK